MERGRGGPMRIGRVVGTVVATRKDESYEGFKFLIVQPGDSGKKSVNKDNLVAVDTVGAGIGEQVLFCTGRASRFAAKKPESAIDAAVVGIIDCIDYQEKDK